MMLDESPHKIRNRNLSDGPSVFKASRINGSLTFVELSAGESAFVHREWLASLDGIAHELVLGRPSDPFARKALEVAEFYLRERDITRAVIVIRLVAETPRFDGSQEHALALEALKNLRSAGHA